jgi:hypothetical protein
MVTAITEFDLKIRHQIYAFIKENCRAPLYQELAGPLDVAEETVRRAYHDLHQGHMIFLEPGADTIRMAFPFSGIPTKFKVGSGQKQWWANCAWDSVGIPAALHRDVEIEAAFPDTGETARFQVKNGRLDGKNHVVYFPLPFQQWYDDLVFT